MNGVDGLTLNDVAMLMSIVGSTYLGAEWVCEKFMERELTDAGKRKLAATMIILLILFGRSWVPTPGDRQVVDGAKENEGVKPAPKVSDQLPASRTRTNHK